jgi:hypothetical protein
MANQMHVPVLPGEPQDFLPQMRARYVAADPGGLPGPQTRGFAAPIIPAAPPLLRIGLARNRQREVRGPRVLLRPSVSDDDKIRFRARRVPRDGAKCESVGLRDCQKKDAWGAYPLVRSCGRTTARREWDRPEAKLR